ncbi:pyridoxamine 5'-phosphate oxidase family protein [Streptomyces sp. NRRL B-1347]|uniref:pyridoxamine 5'-phosphate oxidase family protein n=1 Tax=Streptomyces sp. NRRL B-1347 TaxID=1476877 RepID=UPI0004C4A815|nr:pyridoxamine 5'-phosphate oxidase family protein [Streptomyces sp. NRRL B-1347]
MSTAPAPRRLVEVSGAEALYLLEGSRTGRLVYVRDGAPVLRPAAHVLEYGRLVVRTPVPRPALPAGATVTYHVDEIRTAIGTGWSMSASGPVEYVSDPDELAHYRRTLPGWTHGPHDSLLRLNPQTVSGFRLARAEA